MTETTTLFIDLADYLPDPLPAKTLFEFTVKYNWSEYRPARLAPWPGDPEEPAELEIETCATDVVKDAWLFYQSQFAGLPTVDKAAFVNSLVGPIGDAIDHAEYTPVSYEPDDDYLYECWKDERLGL